MNQIVFKGVKYEKYLAFRPCPVIPDTSLAVMNSSRSSNATALRRLMTEYKQLTAGGAPDGMFTAGPVSESDFFTWEALIQGPEGTPFEGGVFVAKLTFVGSLYIANSSMMLMEFDATLTHTT